MSDTGTCAIEDESWNAALAAGFEAVSGLTFDAGTSAKHYWKALIRDRVLAAFASLRKPDPSEPVQPPAGEGER